MKYTDADKILEKKKLFQALPLQEKIDKILPYLDCKVS